MDINSIHPELRKIIARIPPIPLHNKLFLFVINWLLRFSPRAKSTQSVSIEEHKLKQASIRIYKPEHKASGAGLLWIHGGGYITGNAAMNDRECLQFAKDLGLVVISVEYRLAPKYPFPAAIDDCFEAWQWFISSAQSIGVDPSRIVISGQSAGGGLAASLAQRIHDYGGTQPAGQALFCPMLDDRPAAQYELDSIKHRIWNNKNNRAGWSFYLGYTPGKHDAPEYAVASRRKDVSNLAPAWIAVGNIDLLYKEDKHYATRLTAAGVDCQLYTIPMAPHGFETFAPHALITRDLYREFYGFLIQTLHIKNKKSID